MPDFLFTGPADADTAILLAHGAGAPMDSAWMNAFAGCLGAKNIRVARFEFSYMAARRTGEGRKPPPRADTLLGEYRAAVEAIGPAAKIFIGGKSMGGRVASMVADQLYAEQKIAGLVCLGYPFHPPGSPQKLRTAHLEKLAALTLICRGERDPFGATEEVAGYRLSPVISLFWLEDGDHDFKPRKDSAATGKGNLDAAAERVVEWVVAC